MLNIIAAPASTRDAGAVRIGGYSPVSLPANTKDSGAVRIGGYSPAF